MKPVKGKTLVNFNHKKFYKCKMDSFARQSPLIKFEESLAELIALHGNLTTSLAGQIHGVP